MRVWLTGGSGFVGATWCEASTTCWRPRTRRRRDRRRRRAPQRRRVRADVIVHCRDPQRLRAALEREGWAATSGRRATSSRRHRRPRDPGLDRLGVRRDRRVGRGRRRQPDQPYGMLKAASEQVVRGPRHRRADRRRPGPSRPARRAARTRASATSSPRSSTRCAPASASRSGRAATSTRRHADAGLRRRRADRRALERRATGRLPLLRRRPSPARAGAAHGRAFGLDGAARVRPAARAAGVAVPYDTRLDATATAAALGVELPDLDDQLRGWRGA